MRRRDAPDARLASFSVEGRGSRALPGVAGVSVVAAGSRHSQ